MVAFILLSACTKNIMASDLLKVQLELFATWQVLTKQKKPHDDVIEIAKYYFIVAVWVCNQ